MKGYQIKNMLEDMRLVLVGLGFGSDYHISKRGVPFVHVVVKGRRYQFIYFGKTNLFRVFDDQQNRKDIRLRGDVIQHFLSLREAE